MRLLDAGKVITKEKLTELLRNMNEKMILDFIASHGRSLRIRREGKTFYLTFNRLFSLKRDLEGAIEETWDWIQQFNPPSYELWEEA